MVPAFQGPGQSSGVETCLLTDTGMIVCLIDVKVSKSCLTSPGEVRLVGPHGTMVNLSAFPGCQVHGILGTIENMMYKKFSLPSVATLGGKGRQIVNSEIHDRK